MKISRLGLPFTHVASRLKIVIKKFSHYQKAVFDWVKHGSGNLVVEAVAGSGKSSTLVESMKYMDPRKSILFLAFNKAIVEDLKGKAPSHATVQTFHGLGWSVMQRYLDNPVLDNKKCQKHVSKLFTKNNIFIRDFQSKIKISNNIRKLIEFYRLMVLADPTKDHAEKIAERYDLTILDKEILWSLQIYKSFLEDDSCYDFTDMLFVPIYRNLKFRQYDWVLNDEAQDISGIQIEMILRAKGGLSRMISVGDKNQRIYGFRMASADSFTQLKNLPDTSSLPLSICYRCGKNIVKYAKQLVPQIEHFEENVAGQVVSEGSIKNVKDGDVVLCRINAPLASLAGHFLREHRKVFILGSDMAEKLEDMILASKSSTCAGLFVYTNNKLTKLYKSLIEADPFADPNGDPDYLAMTDKMATLRALAHGCHTTQEVIDKIRTIFTSEDKKQGILLSTCHKFKGQERDNVFIVEPQLIPFPYYLDRQDAREQENNLDYIARTRAKLKLEYIRDWTSFAAKKDSPGPKMVPANAPIPGQEPGILLESKRSREGRQINLAELSRANKIKKAGEMQIFVRRDLGVLSKKRKRRN